MPCEKCDSLSSYELSGQYKLLISAPRGHSATKLLNQLLDNKYNLHKDDNVISLFFSANEASQLGQIINTSFSQVELEDSKALLIPALEANSGVDIVLNHSYSLAKLVGLLLSQWLVDLIKKGSLTTFCQPIVQKDTLEPYGFECLLRGSINGSIIPPSDIFNAAKTSDMLFLLDKRARITHIENMNKVNIGKKIFINFNPTAIYDPFYCLTTTNHALKKTSLDPSQIVFEVIESEQVNDKKHLLSIMEFYRKQGYGVALDDLGSGYSSLNLLSDLKPDYVKLDQELVRNIHTNQFKQVILENICSMANKLRIKIICEGIESEEEYAVIKKYDVDFYQGFLFAKPMPYEQLAQYLKDRNR
ncbi:signal transduction protein (EAL/GGDEF domain protein) [Legionella moravica]|uniref:Signal transduction protein (EAL/GGDEF domain protein) n=1 Tax=Legionella moravica TaxID=39962 RepID=A0A378JXM4_9GAMM|nr:EAL domain-containing protein [Legionella moravica]KTD31678.1 signal transduction protein (EAL/GGDEF domain protein) [Legionella moravica]STX62242.1 signal transduction protein (EAL/GGDEF domain protein) [Legionella moravica]